MSLARCPECFTYTPQFPCEECGYIPQEPPLALALPPLTPLPGPDQIRYRLGRVLGKPGGFGITYLAWDEALKMRVAIKEYYPRQLVGRSTEDHRTLTPHSPPDRAAFQVGLQAFQREAEWLRDSRHPHIIRLRDFFEANGTAYLVMDYYPGRTLAEEVQQRGRLPWPEAVAWLHPILTALHTLHQHGLLHRDVKPANIYRTEAGTPLLLDFGGARQAVGAYSRSLTVVLTPGYAAPEQYSSTGEQKAWTDVYGAAATLYYGLTGEAPPDAPDRSSHDELRPLRRVHPPLDPAVPRALAAAVAKGLAIEGKNRWASAEAFAHQLAKLFPKPASFSFPNRRWLLPLVSGAVATSLAAGFILLWSQTQQPDSPPRPQSDSLSSQPPSLQQPSYLDELLKAANQGDATSQVELGWIYATGQGMEKNEVEAARWFRKAADQGNPVGGMALSIMHRLGLGVTKNLKDAIEWRGRSIKQTPDFFIGYPELVKKFGQTAEAGDLFSQIVLGEAYFFINPPNYSTAAQWYGRAAEQGNPDAQFKLGLMYFNGHGIPQDYQKAAEWYRESAKQGNPFAQYSLGVLYEQGRGVLKDDSKAVEWYRKSAVQGNADAQLNLGEMYANGRGISRDNQEAAEWYRKSADQGNPRAQYNLGVLCEQGLGVPKDDQKAFEWYQKSAAQGHADAQLNLGAMYASGRGILQDYQKAAEWYRKSADRWNPIAQYNLGLLYEQGHGVSKDDQQAFEWYSQSADQGHADAQLNLGVMYASGRGILQDYQKAADWYRKSADQGNPLAQFNLGVLFGNGLGVPQDDQTAFEWYRKSADQGNAYAQNELCVMYASGHGVRQDKQKAVEWCKKSAAQGNASAQKNLDLILYSTPVDYVVPPDSYQPLRDDRTVPGRKSRH